MNNPPSAQNTTSKHPCPTCGKPVAWTSASRWRPFCSERCRLIDLGDWLDEKHRIPESVDDGSEGASAAEQGD